jgi:acetate---CoA ligase (ADP-forming)
LQRFFEPASVVLIGVSRKVGPGAYNNLATLLNYGYQGRIYLVHPKIDEILDRPTHHRVADLPEVPDLAVISLGRDRVKAAVTECVQHGIKGIVVISQGFADADDRGQELQEKIVAIAREHGARVVGPNTMGIVNPFAAFSTAFIDLPRDSRPAPLTVVAQSGAFQVSPHSLTVKMGKAIDVGNAGDVDVADVLDYLETDPQTRVIMLHLEGIRRGREFLQTAARVARTKPIIAFKTGRSAAGALAAMSHTGSLVGEDAVVDLALARAGIIRARNLVELRAICRAFLHYRAMHGPRLGVVTATGAFGIIAADACEDYGLELAPFPEKLRELEEERVAWHKIHNPVDLWPLGMVTGSFTRVFRRAVHGLIEDANVDAVLGVPPAFVSPLHSDLDIPAAVRKVLAENREHKPIALQLYGDEEACRQQARALEQEADVACFESLDEAVMGLAAVWRYQQFQQREPQGLELPAAPAVRPVTLPAQGVLVGEAALELLRSYRIPVVPGSLATDGAAVRTVANQLGYPVVLKIISPAWLHKSDWGGVRLQIADEAALKDAYEDLLRLFREKTPAGRLEGILVQKQVQGVELLLGLKHDPQFGPVVVAAAGGIYTEILKDAAQALAPVTAAEARKMLAALKIYPVLKGVRGQAGVDFAQLEGVILALSRLAADYPEIKELDLNPVMAAPAGCWAVDCRVVL